MTSQWHRKFSSQALYGFTNGEPLPYTMEDGTTVVPARARERFTWGSPIKGSVVHLIRDLAVAWTPDGMRLGARWLCGGSSIGAQLYDPEAYWAHWSEVYIRSGATGPDDVVCPRCRDARDGTKSVTASPCVYRCFDKRGDLLYIGSTKNWLSRQAAHRNGTWWWPVVKDVELESYDDLADARAAEAAAIQSERPRLNVMHNRRPA